MKMGLGFLFRVGSLLPPFPPRLEYQEATDSLSQFNLCLSTSIHKFFGKRKEGKKIKIEIKVGDSYYCNVSFGVTLAKPALKWTACMQRQRGKNTRQER